MARQLSRELGVTGATLMGLGSIVGTGIFVSVGIGAGLTWQTVTHHMAGRSLTQ